MIILFLALYPIPVIISAILAFFEFRQQNKITLLDVMSTLLLIFTPVVNVCYIANYVIENGEDVVLWERKAKDNHD